MSEIKSRLAELAAEASRQGLSAPTEKQIDYIIALMDRRNLSAKLFDSQTMLTKRGASNYIDDIKVMNRGIV
jgi:hypothetical protein